MKPSLGAIFASTNAGSGCEPRQFRIVTRHSHPLLYLPHSRQATQIALSLYPAQRSAARMLRAALQVACAGNLLKLLPATEVALALDAPLTRFLTSLDPGGNLPEFAALAGNPNAAGQRFILLVFGPDARPAIVVKAGATSEAMRLIRQEIEVLQSTPTGAQGLPRIRSTVSDERVQAFAIDFIPGDPPRSQPANTMAGLLHSWVDVSRRLPISELPIWQRLTREAEPSPLLKTLTPALASTSVCPTLYHGDFAPWNIKVSPHTGAWTVLDWERGELVGLPCWDWFHYRIQTGLLVDRLPAETHARQIEQWLAAEDFVHYARIAGAWEVRKELLLAYLLYNLEVIRPAEGAAALRELMGKIAPAS